MNKQHVPDWILSLEDADLVFVKNFLINSGSLKSVAKVYDVSYPTVRIKLDRLIQKIALHDEMEQEGFITFIKKLSIDDQISLESAKLIIDKYKTDKEE